jgi:hypothetical protein
LSVNFSNSTPAAPSGGTNLLWQTDGSGNISAYTLSSAPILTTATLNLTGQSAAITTANLYATTAAGIYRLSYYLYITTAGNSVNLTGTFGWTDDSGASANSVATGNIACQTLGANSTTALGLGSVTFYAANTTNITYATALSGAIGTGRYAVRVRLENLS